MRLGIRSVCLSLIVIAAHAAQPAFPTNEDLRHYRSLNAPRLSPDGRQVLVRIVDSTADGAKSHLWLVDIEKNTSRQLTYSPGSDKAGELAGEWMPGGESILFLAHRGEHKQLFRLPMAGGEAKPFDLKVLPPVDASKLPNALPPVVAGAKPEAADQLPLEPSAFEISPDGKMIAFLANDPKTPGEKKQLDAKADANWVGHDLHGTRLYLLEIATGNVSPVAVPIDVNQVAWAKDSSKLLAICEEPNGISDLSPASSTWTVQPNQPANPVKISGLPATIQTAAWSTDGKSILFLAQAEKDTPPGYRDLFEYKLDSHAIQNDTGDFGGSAGFQGPIPLEGGSILLPVNQGVTASLLRFNPGAKPHPLSFNTPVVGSFHSNASNTSNASNVAAKQTGWVFLGMGPGQPATLFYAPALDQPARVLNTPSLTPANSQTVASKHISWKSGSFTIEGLLYLPPQASDHKVPLIVEVHGGPLGAYLDDYSPFVQFLVGHGWAVLRTNPRGSSNYGAAFAAANKNDLGGGDYRDIMAGVDFVLKTESVDAARMALEGYSYGGEMAGFVEGKTSRFKAIISGAPVIDQYSEYGTENGSFYDRWYFGKPWEHPEDAWRQSPLAGVSHATTPFLLLQGENDATDPLGQSQEMYRALKQAGVPVQMVTYPREDHGPLARGIYGGPAAEPWHGFDARQRIVEFLEKEFAAVAH